MTIPPTNTTTATTGVDHNSVIVLVAGMAHESRAEKRRKKATGKYPAEVPDPPASGVRIAADRLDGLYVGAACAERLIRDQEKPDDEQPKYRPGDIPGQSVWQ